MLNPELYYLHPLCINLLQNSQEIDFLCEQLRCMFRKRGTIILMFSFHFKRVVFTLQRTRKRIQRVSENSRLLVFALSVEWLSCISLQFSFYLPQRSKTRRAKRVVSSLFCAKTRRLIEVIIRYSASQHPFTQVRCCFSVLTLFLDSF